MLNHLIQFSNPTGFLNLLKASLGCQGYQQSAIKKHLLDARSPAAAGNQQHSASECLDHQSKFDSAQNTETVATRVDFPDPDRPTSASVLRFNQKIYVL